MARISLQSVISADFVNRFRGLASSSSGSSSIASTLKGGSAVTVADGLRAGARTFSVAIQSLNSAISLANISRATLEELGKITDELITLAER